MAAGGPRAVHHNQTTSGIYQSSTMGKSSVSQVGASIQENVSVNFAHFKNRTLKPINCAAFAINSATVSVHDLLSHRGHKADWAMGHGTSEPSHIWYFWTPETFSVTASMIPL